ncbi:hypothetical protein ACRALDRAFT_1066884 [Sodiomyces alcalophilus JCM 7366]|uniref:uncharacterized protein n=1 Tax=Sodiomyces alcalophilus JCM 7366 TaxID=591952 RepID=UPI0039B5554C
MSTTVTMTTVAAPALPAPSLSLSTDLPNPASSSPCCPGCGLAIPPTNPAFQTDGERGGAKDEEAAASLLEAQARIADLEAQVRLLNQKASAAIDRWADYEDELARLRQELESRRGEGQQDSSNLTRPSPPPKEQDPSASPTRYSYLPSSAAGVTNRLSALLTRKSTANLVPNNNDNPSSPSSDAAAPDLLSPESSSAAIAASHPLNAHADLLSALHREQSLRVAAENRLTASSREVEELSASLFEQANEMVATERRARAKLEERVELLERRDAEKRRRLDKLEGAVGRIERVRALLGQERLGKARGGDEEEGGERMDEMEEMRTSGKDKPCLT